MLSMERKNNIIIISGIIFAFIFGTLTANPIAEAANPALVAIQTTLGLIQTETDKIQMVKNNQYVPFTQASNLNTLCDAAGGSSTTKTVRVKGTSDTILITGMTLRVDGVDSATDSIKIVSYSIGGFSLGATQSNDLTGNIIGSGALGAMAFDVMGVPLAGGANFPTEIAVISSGLDTIFECNAGTTTNMNIRIVFVSGWKNVDDTVSVTVGL